MHGVNVDIINRNSYTGEVATQFANDQRLNVEAMRPFVYKGKTYINVFTGGDRKKRSNWKAMPLQGYAGTLRRDEWKALDSAVIDIARDRLTGVADLRNKGLVYPLGNAMGTTVLEWHDVGDSMEAVMTMDGVTRGQGDRPTFQFNYLPIPIIHVDFEINARALAASRNMGNPVDTTSAEHAARKVVEWQEDMLFTDTSFNYGEKDDRNRNAIYSYVNFPDRNTQTIKSWTDSDKTAKEIVNDVLQGKQKSINAFHYGPWTVYIPTAYETVLDEDYDSSTPGTTIRERILKISGIQEIKVADHLADDNVLMIEMKRETVRLVEGFGLQTVEWSTEGRFVNKYKVMTISVPQIRSDRNGKTGIVHMSV